MDHLLEYEDFNLNESMDSEFNKLISDIKKDGIIIVGKPFKNKDGNKAVELKFPKDFMEVTGELNSALEYPFYLVADKGMDMLVLAEDADGYEDVNPDTQDASDVYFHLTNNKRVDIYKAHLKNNK